MSNLKFEVSLAFGIGLAVSWTVCVIVLFAVFYLAIIKRKSPVYIISTGHIFVDIIMLSTFLFYLIPCALADDYIFPGGRQGFIGILAAFFFEFAWLYVTLSQIFMALNRLVVVCYPGREFFSFFTVSVVTISLFPTAAFLSALASFFYPCCAIIFNHHLLSYNYELKDGFINYSNWFLNFPVNTSSSIIALLCYSYVSVDEKNHLDYSNRFSYTSKNQQSFLMLKTKQPESDKKKEKSCKLMNSLIYSVTCSRYSLQFCAISLFHFLEWTTFRILPSIIDMTSPKFHPAFVIVGVFVCLNSSMNSLVYLLCNEEVQNTLKMVFRRTGLSKNTTQVRTFSITPTSNRL